MQYYRITFATGVVVIQGFTSPRRAWRWVSSMIKWEGAIKCVEVQ